MTVRVFGCNHIAIEVDDIEKAVEFYTDVFNLQLQDDGEGDAFFAWGITSSWPYSRWNRCVQATRPTLV